MEILETQHPKETELIQNCRVFMQSIEKFVNYEASSLVDYYFLPFLHHKEFRESFITEQALLSRNTKSDSNYLAGIYLADKEMASEWHHNMLMQSRS
jgi:hypothetical protein